MNPFDVAIIGVLVISALFAFVRGFMKEILSILVWVGAGVIAYFGYPYVLPLALHLTTEAWLAQAGTAVVTFVVALILLALVSSTISTSIRGTALGPIDRILGLLYGLVRGAVIVCLVYIGVTVLIAEADRPAWFTNARSLPTLARGAALLENVLPSGAKSLATETIDTGKQLADPGTVLGSRPILPSRTETPAVTPPTTLPTQGSAGTLSESERMMRPPPPVTPPPPEKPVYPSDDRNSLGRIIHGAQ